MRARFWKYSYFHQIRQSKYCQSSTVKCVWLVWICIILLSLSVSDQSWISDYHFIQMVLLMIITIITDATQVNRCWSVFWLYSANQNNKNKEINYFYFVFLIFNDDSASVGSSELLIVCQFNCWIFTKFIVSLTT